MARSQLTPEQVAERRAAFDWGVANSASWQAMAARIGLSDEAFRMYAKQHWPEDFIARVEAMQAEPAATSTIDEAEAERRLAGYRRAVEHRLTLREIAEELRVTPSALRRWFVRQGLSLKLDQLKALQFEERKPRLTQRFCLRCRDSFQSEGAHHRLCNSCRGLSVSPYHPASDGDGGRRVGRAR